VPTQPSAGGGETVSGEYTQRPLFQEGRFSEENSLEGYKDLYDPEGDAS